MKKQINQIREFFWPLLDPLPNSVSIASAKLVVIVEDENLEIAFNLQSKILENEEDRRKGIESKAALLLSTISIAFSVVVAASSLISKNVEIALITKISISISFILSLYVVRTVWFSVKALERKSFKVLGFKDFNIEGSKNEYQKSIIMIMAEYAKHNQKVVNEKIDFLTMAQEYYKRAIVVISLYSFMIFIYGLCVSKMFE